MNTITTLTTRIQIGVERWGCSDASTVKPTRVHRIIYADVKKKKTINGLPAQGEPNDIGVHRPWSLFPAAATGEPRGIIFYITF